MGQPWRSFREWIEEEEKIGEVLRIKTPVKCGDPSSIVDAVPADVREASMRVNNCSGASGKQMETELRALGSYLHTLPNKPIGFIEKPVNNMPSVPIIVNPWATRERALRMLGCKDKEELCRKLRELKTNLIKPVVVGKNEAPVKEVVITEDKLDLHKDVPRNWVEFENVPYSPTGGSQWIVGDPETGTHDLGEWRCAFFEWEDGDPNKPFPEERRKKDVWVSLIYQGPFESDGGRFYRERFRNLNKPMPAAFAMCSDPGVVATACLRKSLTWPEGGIDEYAAAGGFRGAPVEVVESETIPGLMVPAHAEWVFEGNILPEDCRKPLYNQAILEGYMFGGQLAPVFRTECITHRKDPLWCTTWSYNGLSHDGVHMALLYLIAEAEAINHLRQSGYNVKDVVSYDLSMTVAQSDIDGAQKTPHYGKALLNTLYGCPNRYIGNSNKYLIVVGPDINPYDLRDVIWALNTRTQPLSDSIRIEKGVAGHGDPSAGRGPQGYHTYGEQMLIDALIKVPEAMAEYEPRSEPVFWEKEAVKRMRDKMGTE
ncbi:UbiD family decarboxylase domain-containing protein [Chloroflexota bacterium]